MPRRMQIDEEDILGPIYISLVVVCGTMWFYL